MLSVFSLGNIITPLTAAAKAASAASNFFAMIDAPVADRKGLKGPAISARGDISFKKVTFAYPSRPHVKVLDELDLCFEAGKLTAIVGPSGSGKSTVVGLIERWYELSSKNNAPSDQIHVTEKITNNDGDAVDNKSPITLSGVITVGERDVEGLDLKWWRSQIGLVQQEPFIFNDTIYKNVAYGLVGTKFENEDEETKRGLVEEACKEAFADEFIVKLPQV